MKIKIFFIAILFIAFANWTQAQAENPVLKNTFKESSGQLVVVDMWNRLKVSALNYETVTKLIAAVESLKQDLQNANKTISEQKRTIDRMQHELNEQKRKLDAVENDMRNLKNKLK
ncbi:MAG: keratin [Prevotellaceae bacterium]|jgi:peptidoglycan hydrolase CwlO-like protein|nr:keratin [Prevotellaceae bacterium]